MSGSSIRKKYANDARRSSPHTPGCSYDAGPLREYLNPPHSSDHFPNCIYCTEQGKKNKTSFGSRTKDSVVEPNEEVHIDFAGPLPDELSQDAYVLVAIDK